MPISHIEVLVQVPATALLIKLYATVLKKAEDDGLLDRTVAIHISDLDE